MMFTMTLASLPITYLEFLDSVIDYALLSAQGQTAPHHGISDELAAEVDHVIATVKAAQSNTCMWLMHNSFQVH